MTLAETKAGAGASTLSFGEDAEPEMGTDR